MPLSQVGICNLALSRIGITEKISDLTDVTDSNAVACSVVYDATRDRLLAMADWPFARRWVVLGLVATAPTTFWGYSYRVPSDCLVARTLTEVPGIRMPYDLSSDSAGMLLLTDEVDPTLRYTSRVDVVGLMPALFADALAWQIAYELAPGKAKTDSAAQRAAQEAMRATNFALKVCMNEPRQRLPAEADVMTVRG